MIDASLHVEVFTLRSLSSVPFSLDEAEDIDEDEARGVEDDRNEAKEREEKLPLRFPLNNLGL